MRILVAVICFIASLGVANAQAPTITELPPLTGTAIGPGYAAVNGQLFIPNSASLQSLSLPFTFSYDILMPTTPASTSVFVNASSASTGFEAFWNSSFTFDFYHFQGIIKPAVTGSAACDAGQAGKMCWRGAADPTRHHYCWVFQPNHMWLYQDGIVRDENTNVGSFTSPAVTWGLLQSGVPPDATIYDFRVASTAWPADECVRVSRLNQAGLIPNSGLASTNLLLHLALNDCTITGALYQCPDTSGNGNTSTNDKAAPIVVVTSPSPGMVSGTSVTMQATCTDPGGITCASVCYLVDGALVSTSCPTTAPYTFSWNSTRVIDGSHTVTAAATNQAGVFGTSAGVAITTANSVSPKTVWLNSSTGSDSNNCLSSGAACATFAHIQSAITLLGGDTFNVIGTFTNSAAFKLCGPSSGCTQNFFPSSSTLTITTTGGACNPFTLTTTGCGVINVSGANDGIDILNGGNVTVTNLGILGSVSATPNNIGINISSTLPTFTSLPGIAVTNNYIRDFQEEVNLVSAANNAPITGYSVIDNVATNTTHLNPGSLSCIRAAANTQGTLQGNLATQCGGGFHNNGNGIVVSNYPSPVGFSNTLFQFNVVHDFGWNDGNPGGGPVGCYVTFADKVTVQNNECYNGIPNTTMFPPPNFNGAIDYDCLDVDIGSTNVLEQYNYAHDCPVQSGLNIVVSPGINPQWNNNTLRYNIIENVAECIAVDSTNSGNLPTNTWVYNNTCAQSNIRPNFGSICWGASAGEDVVLANNVCVYTGTVQGDYVNFNYTPGKLHMAVLNNDYFSTSSISPTWIFNQLFTTPVRYTTLSAYQAATIAVFGGSGLDVNSLNIDPQFAGTPATAGTCWPGDGGGTPPTGPQNPPTSGCPSVYVLSGSNLKGMGVDITSLPGTPPVNPTVDYYGNSISSPPNIGAYGGH